MVVHLTMSIIQLSRKYMLKGCSSGTDVAVLTPTGLTPMPARLTTSRKFLAALSVSGSARQALRPPDAPSYSQVRHSDTRALQIRLHTGLSAPSCLAITAAGCTSVLER